MYERDWERLDDDVLGNGCDTCRFNQDGCQKERGILCYDASLVGE